jgi:hypothetical protein
MHAAIVLHGLFLLVCYPDAAKKHCEIWVPHTRMNGMEMHNYTAGFGQSFVPFSEQMDKSKSMTIDLQAGNTTGFPFHTNSGMEYKARQFTLAGDQISKLDRTQVRDIISIPWPDEIYGLNRVLAPAMSVAPMDSQLVQSPATYKFYLISETVVLYYAQGAPFNLLDENGALVEPSAAGLADNMGNVLTWALVLSSEPYGCNLQGDHTKDFNALIIKADGTNPAFVLTGLSNTQPGGSETTGAPLLPPGVLDPPCQITVTQARKTTKNASHFSAVSKWYKLTGRPTGCGVISYPPPSGP